MFFDEAALAALFAHFHGYLHAELADAATTIVHAMATSTVQPTLTTRGMYPFRDNYMYFVPYERVGRRTLARVAAEMDDGCTEESTLDNGETVVVLTGISEVTGVEPLLRAVCGYVLRTGDASSSARAQRISALSVLLQRLVNVVHIPTDTMETLQRAVADMTTDPPRGGEQSSSKRARVSTRA